jgi:hypothetical protein
MMAKLSALGGSLCAERVCDTDTGTPAANAQAGAAQAAAHQTKPRAMRSNNCNIQITEILPFAEPTRERIAIFN